MNIYFFSTCVEKLIILSAVSDVPIFATIDMKSFL